MTFLDLGMVFGAVHQTLVRCDSGLWPENVQIYRNLLMKPRFLIKNYKTCLFYRHPPFFCTGGLGKKPFDSRMSDKTRLIFTIIKNVDTKLHEIAAKRVFKTTLCREKAVWIRGSRENAAWFTVSREKAVWIGGSREKAVWTTLYREIAIWIGGSRIKPVWLRLVG